LKISRDGCTQLSLDVPVETEVGINGERVGANRVNSDLGEVELGEPLEDTQ